MILGPSKKEMKEGFDRIYELGIKEGRETIKLEIMQELDKSDYFKTPEEILILIKILKKIKDL